MSEEIKKAWQTIEDIKIKLRTGGKYEDCYKEAQPALEILNQKGREIAKEYGKKYKPLSFIAIMR